MASTFVRRTHLALLVYTTASLPLWLNTTADGSFTTTTALLTNFNHSNTAPPTTQLHYHTTILKICLTLTAPNAFDGTSLSDTSTNDTLTSKRKLSPPNTHPTWRLIIRCSLTRHIVEQCWTPLVQQRPHSMYRRFHESSVDEA